jgi:CHAT domain-containing protein
MWPCSTRRSSFGPRRCRPRFAHAELAFLATSDTTVPDLPDEAISIAAAYQFAGFRHVIAGTRYLSDQVAAEAARMFYRSLLGSTADLKPADALNTALRQLKAQASDVARWASYVHYGP